jgi:ankyrin repeat protein
MRLLRWSSQNELSLTDDLDKNIPPYAILSHTWGLDRNEVTFADIQKSQGQSKVGYAKIRFCGEQARRDGIEYFWVDTCCINKDNHVELSKAITLMFGWYRDAKKCYVYLSDVSVRKGDNIGEVQSMWESSLRISRWFTRGWTLQELLAPAIVEFFSQEEDFIGTKQTLAQLIHEVTTLPLAALRGTPLAQFPIDEKIRWTKKRQTRETEDGAYCLLGIFNVFMPLIYGEGDNAFRRLKEEINKQFGSNIAGRLGVVDEVRSLGLCQRLAPLNDVDDFIGRAADVGQTAQVSRLGEPRPAKRVRTSYDANISGPSNSRSYGNTTISHMEVMGGHIQQSGQGSKHNSMMISEDKYNILLKSLLFDRIDFRVNNVKKALLSTCQWLFRHPHFQTWYENGCLAQHSGFLWIKGKPGCGKSTLMKTLFEWLRRRKSKDRVQQTIVPYFFNARASASLEKSSLGLYRTVVHHLLSSYPSIRTLFAEKFALKDPGQLGENWSVEELQEFLYDTIESNESFGLCLLIDALDEAEYEDDVRQMISFLLQLFDRALALGSSCKLHICLSSRHYPHISITRGLSLVVEDQLEHGQDIDNYITKELTCLDGPEKGRLRAEILNKSARIFLWVVLVVQILNKLDDRGVPLSEMKARLKTIPAGLNELFQEILMKSDDGIETSMLFFQWMVFRMRPLQPAELFVAMEYSKSPDNPIRTLPTEISVPAPDRLTRFVLNCSRGLVEAVEVAPSQAATVQFIHETVREFLLKENGLASISRALATNVAGISHEILRIACFRCISMNDMPKEYEHYCEASHKTNASLDIFRSEMRLKLPFLDYAISYLFDHVEQAQKHGISQLAFLKNQIDANGLWLDLHRLWWNVLERYKSKKVTSGVTLIYFIAEQQYSNLLPVLLSVSTAVNTICGNYGSVLQVSSYHGSREIVQMLLDKGANVNAQGGRYGNALQAASDRGHENVVQTLLDRGADVNAQGGSYGNALYAASVRGDEKVVQTLLDAGANVNAQGGRYGNALQAASVHGHENVVQTLLDRGADVNAQGGSYGKALYAASECGDEKVVQTLLDGGADVNAQGGYYGNALYAASVRGDENVVKTLLDGGADVNAQGGYYRNALYAASVCGHEKVVQILLDGGTDVNAQGGYYRNALQAASESGHEKVVRILHNYKQSMDH